MYESCMSSLPYCDLELSGKVMRSSEPSAASISANSVFGKLQKDQDAEAATISKTIPSMQIIFSLKSMEEFMFLVLEVSTQTWTLGYTSSAGVTILNQVVDDDIRSNQFYNVLIQLRGPTLSVDINNVPVFTSVRAPPEMEGLGGYPGILARRGTRFAIKDWKLRAIIGPEDSLGRGGGGNVAEQERGHVQGEVARLGQTREQEQERGERLLEYEDYEYEDGGGGGGTVGAEESFVQDPIRVSDYQAASASAAAGVGAGAGRGEGSAGKSLVFLEDEDGDQFYASPAREAGSGGGGGGGAEGDDGHSAYLPRDVASEPAKQRKSMSLADLMKEKRSQRDAVSPRQAPAPAPAAPTAAPPPHPTVSVPRRGSSSAAGTLASASSPFFTPPVSRRRASESLALHSLFPKQGQAAMRRGTAQSVGRSSLYASAAGAALPPPATYTASDGSTASAASSFSAFALDDTPYVGPGAVHTMADSSNLRMVDATRELLQRHEKSVVDTVMRDVVQQDLGVAFTDIAALGEAKRLLSEAVILPLAMPEFFTGIREPWKGVLLFGPPGTGKTLLAKAVCTLNQSAFFSCPSSSLVSKFRGESEKIVRCLFEAARLLAPSVVFLDEIDALVGSRGETGEHEASRRLKTEIFSQMDGIASGNTSSNSGGGGGEAESAPVPQRVMVLATTNCPWDLDEAIRRRLEKRIFIPLPDKAARKDLFSICLKGIQLAPDVDLAHLAGLGEGYSGADIHVVCREAAMMPMRRLLEQVADPTEIAALVAASKAEGGTQETQEVTMTDFVTALKNTRPSVASGASDRYARWEREYGSK